MVSSINQHYLQINFGYDCLVRNKLYALLKKKSWSGLPFLLQGIFLTQRLNPCLLHCRQIHHLNYQGSPSMFSHIHTNIPQTLFAPHFGISTDNCSFMVALILLSSYILSAIASCLKSNRRFIVVCALFKNLCIDTNKYHLLSLNGCNEVF